MEIRIPAVVTVILSKNLRRTVIGSDIVDAVIDDNIGIRIAAYHSILQIAVQSRMCRAGDIDDSDMFFREAREFLTEYGADIAPRLANYGSAEDKNIQSVPALRVR